MKFTLITPSLNNRDLLADCLDNVATLGPHLEHIVCDGGSDDGTLALLAQVAAERPWLSFSSQPDGGMYEALNRGLARAQGDIIGYLNCDDLLLPWALTTVRETFARHPDCDVLVGDAIEAEPERATLVIHPPTSSLPAYLRGGGHLAQPAVFFRRRVLEDVPRFDDRYRLLGDHAFFLSLLGRGRRFRRVWEILSVVRARPGRLMDAHATRARKERADIAAAFGTQSHSRDSHRMFRLWHRVGLLSFLAPHGGLLWRHARQAQVLVLERPAALRCLVSSSQGRVYARLHPDLHRVLGLSRRLVIR